MNQIVSATFQRFSNLLAEGHSDCESRLRAVEINRLARADAYYVRLFLRAVQTRRYDIHMMTKPACLARKEMHVLADSAKMRVVVLGNECNPERPRE